MTRDNNEIHLNVKEFALLKCLMEHSGEAMSKEQLFNEVWGSDCFTDLCHLTPDAFARLGRIVADELLPYLEKKV